MGSAGLGEGQDGVLTQLWLSSKVVGAGHLLFPLAYYQGEERRTFSLFMASQTMMDKTNYVITMASRSGIGFCDLQTCMLKSSVVLMP